MDPVSTPPPHLILAIQNSDNPNPNCTFSQAHCCCIVSIIILTVPKPFSDQGFHVYIDQMNLDTGEIPLSHIPTKPDHVS